MLYDTFYYYTSMLKVYGAIFIIVFAFPLVMWREYLRDKRYSFRFLFCLITQNCFCINLVLLLGFIGICNTYTMFAGLIVEYIVVTRRFKRSDGTRDKNAFIKNLSHNKLLGKRFFSSLFMEIRRAMKAQLIRFVHLPLWGYLVKNWFIVLAIGAALVYNAYFLCHNVNINHCFQFSDIPVHQSWIYALEKGTLFVDGVYPFGMHAMIYTVRALTGINLREVLLYFGSFQTLMVMLSMYCLARRIFKGRCTALIPVVLFSLLQNNGRYAASLPQETGMFAVLTLAYFMLEFLHSRREKHIIKSDRKMKRIFRINQYFFRRYLTVDVLLIALSVALVVEYHFYTAIAAVMLVISFALAYLPRLVHKEYWVPLASAGFLGALIAIAPFGACLMKGIPFQKSMEWATSVIKGEKWEYGTGAGYLETLEQVKEGGAAEDASSAETADTSAETTSAADNRPHGLMEWIRAIYDALIGFGNFLYGTESSQIMLVCMAIAVFASFIYAMFKSTRFVAGDYLGITLYVFILCVMGCAGTLHIVQIFESNRTSVFLQPLLFILYAIPVDAVLRPLLMVKFRALTAAVSALTVALSGAVGYYIVDTGHMHNYFDLNLAYFNEPEYVLRQIKQEYPKNSFTVVSPTEEFYEVLDYGYHTELSEFINMVDGGMDMYTFPTQYVFFFIEKQVMHDFFLGTGNMVSPDRALDKFVYLASDQDYYYQRVALESKAYYWAQECREMYPNLFRTFFENDIYVVYILEQNSYYPLNLKIDYQTKLIAEGAKASE